MVIVVRRIRFLVCCFFGLVLFCCLGCVLFVFFFYCG